MLHKYDLKERNDSEVMELNGYGISADRKKNVLCKRPGLWHYRNREEA